MNGASVTYRRQLCTERLQVCDEHAHPESATGAVSPTAGSGGPPSVPPPGSPAWAGGPGGELAIPGPPSPASTFLTRHEPQISPHKAPLQLSITNSFNFRSDVYVTLTASRFDRYPALVHV